MRAVILCAGMGTRLRPFTYLKPKPLLTIGGKTLLERTITMLQSSDVNDITVVLGYKADEVIPLLKKLNVSWIVSELYQTHNNHSSLKLVKDKLDDCIIIDGDLYIQKNITKLIVPNKSQFIAQQTVRGKEWGISYDENGVITSISKDMPSGYAMSGVSYWTGNAAKILANELEKCSKDEFWEDAAIRVIKQTPVYLTKSTQFQVEIDSLCDALEKSIVTADELAEQCSLTQPEKLKGLTNNTFLVDFGQGKKVLRIPGLGTSAFIDRNIETAMVGLLDGLNITPRTDFYADGIKTTDYLEGYDVLTKENINDNFLKNFGSLLKKMHHITLNNNTILDPFCLLEEMPIYERKAGISFVTNREREILQKICEELDNDTQVLSHRDLLLENIMIKNDDIKIIDFEYAVFTSRYWDIACFIIEADLNDAQQLIFLSNYEDLDKEKILKGMIIVDYFWALWGWINNCVDYGRARLINFHKNLTTLKEIDPGL